MAYKKLILPELEKPKPLEPKIAHPEILRVTPVEEGKQPIIIAKIRDDAPGGGWKKMLLDEDPISVTDITKKFTDPDNTYSGRATAQYDTQIVPATPGKSFEASLIDCWNNGDTDVTVAFRFGTATPRFEKKIASKTGYIVNLVKTIWRGPANTAFNIYSYDPSPDLRYTVFGELT